MMVYALISRMILHTPTDHLLGKRLITTVRYSQPSLSAYAGKICDSAFVWLVNFKISAQGVGGNMAEMTTAKVLKVGIIKDLN